MKVSSKVIQDLIVIDYDPLELMSMTNKELLELHDQEFPPAPVVVITATPNGGVSRKLVA